MNKASRTNFCKPCAGTAMVELAIILPLFLLIVFGVTELGRALYQQNRLTQAVELGGRYMARVNDAVDVDADTGDCSTGDNWRGAVDDAKKLIEFGCLAVDCTDPILPAITFVDDLAVPDDPDNSFSVIKHTSSSVSACVITVKATADFQSIFGEDLIAVPVFGLAGILQLNAATQERYIGH